MRSTTTVKDKHILLLRTLRLVQAIRQSRRRRLVDDAQHIQAGNDTRILRRLALAIVEIGRNRDDRILHSAAEIRLGRRLHLLENRS